MSNTLLDEVERLLLLLKGGLPEKLGAIPWASPVVSFGNPANSKVATLGLNPSNLEFMDTSGEQLVAPNHRFESLMSLCVRTWGGLGRRDAQRILQACEDYFFRNPYNQWFKRLDKVLIETGTSYYTRLGDGACHLDLVPFATKAKWSALSPYQRARLIEMGVPSLARTLSASNVRVLVLNGSSVVREFARLVAPGCLRSHVEPSWTLQDGRVQGVAHVGRVSEVGGIALRRELLVLGFNHNIQSSFGVTTQVVSNIAAWIGRQSVGVLA